MHSQTTKKPYYHDDITGRSRWELPVLKQDDGTMANGETEEAEQEEAGKCQEGQCLGPEGGMDDGGRPHPVRGTRSTAS